MEIRIVNKSEKSVEIDIDGFIGWDDEASWRTIKKQLVDVANSKVAKIIVNINSLGGFVKDGLMIHDALKVSKAEIETRVYSMSASAATVIAQAGDKRKMSSNALYLIHRAMDGVFGNVNEMEAVVEDLKKVDNVLMNIYLKKGGNEAKIRELMEANNGNGKWIDAEEALDAGLIDEITEPTKAAASAEAVNEFINKFNLPPIPEKFMSKKTFFQQALEVVKNFGKTDEEIAAEEAAEAAAETTEETTAAETEETTQESEEVSEETTEATEEEGNEETEEEAEETEEEAEEEPENSATELAEKVQMLQQKVEDLTEQLKVANSKLVKAGAKSTKPKGTAGREDDDIENVNVPFAKEVEMFNENFMLGKPLENPKQREKETQTD